jgi:hypothetical protein
MAMRLGKTPKGCIHPIDRDSQYCCHDYQKWLRQPGLVGSMSGKGNCYDNGAVEKFFTTVFVGQRKIGVPVQTVNDLNPWGMPSRIWPLRR